MTRRQRRDTLDTLLARGSISRDMYDAGQRFAGDFARAFCLGPSSSWLPETGCRVDASPSSTSRTIRDASAAATVRRALDAVGGICSPGAQALWHVVGMGATMDELASATGMHRRFVAGALAAALATLARHYGFVPPRRDVVAAHYMLDMECT